MGSQRVRHDFTSLSVTNGLPCGSGRKESTCNAGDPGLIPGLGKIFWRREWKPTLVFLPGGFHGQRTLADELQSIESQSQTGLRD